MYTVNGLDYHNEVDAKEVYRCQNVIKVDALETSNGIKVGDMVYFGGYKRIDGEIEPLVLCQVESVTLWVSYKEYYRIRCTVPSGNPGNYIEAAESYFRQENFIEQGYEFTIDGVRV